MEIVIDIPREKYDMVRNKTYCGIYDAVIYKAIANGTPLPKGHGDLIDKNEIKRMIEEAKVNSEHSKTFAENIIRFAPTIIEADTESGGEE